MFQSLIPDRHLVDVCALTPSYLQKRGIRLVLADLDNTLSDYRALSPDDSVSAWMEQLSSLGIALVVLSNNNAGRVRGFCDPLGLPCVPKSGKPHPLAIWNAMKSHGAAPGETLMVGDQIFTDIRAAKRAGVHAVLVNPRRPNLWHSMRRLLEMPFIFQIRKDNDK